MSKVITIEQSVMAEDERYALLVRQKLKEKNILAVNIIGAPGCGKTTLLEQTARAAKFRFAVIEGDLETSRDADRMAAAGITALQINTKGGCHLEAHVVSKALDGMDLEEFDVLFVENVGNLVCPVEFDLGEDFKLAVASTPEGADKPLKYPALFMKAAGVVLTKTDLIPYVHFDRDSFMRDVKTLNPRVPVMELDLFSGRGLDLWLSFIVDKVEEKKRANAR